MGAAVARRMASPIFFLFARVRTFITPLHYAALTSKTVYTKKVALPRCLHGVGAPVGGPLVGGRVSHSNIGSPRGPNAGNIGSPKMVASRDVESVGWAGITGHMHAKDVV